MMTMPKPFSTVAALRAERELDKARAVRDYEADKRAWEANMLRLRALRQAKESVDAQAAPARRLIKKRPEIREASPARARRTRRTVP